MKKTTERKKAKQGQVNAKTARQDEYSNLLAELQGGTN